MKNTKVTGTIVDVNRNLIGLTIQGTEKDFGRMGKAPATMNVTIAELAKMGFSNKQVSVSSRGILERGNFRLNTLPMTVYVNNNLIPVGNGIKLIGRYDCNGSTVGYRVKYEDNSEEGIKTAVLVDRSKWFKPVNFIVRRQDVGTSYIAGANGLVIADLPVIDVASSNKKSKRKASNTVRTGGIGTPTATNRGSGYDILDIFDTVEKLNGQIIKFDGDKYTRIDTDKSGDVEGFNDYHFGEVAFPKLAFNATKLNANGAFKKVGYVPVSIGGVNKRITTYIHRTKSIFVAGENNMQTIGIAIPESKSGELLGALGGSLAIEEIKDSNTINCLNAIIDFNGEQVKVYQVNTKSLDLISADKREKGILSHKNIEDICLKRFENKLISKFLSPKTGLLKELKTKIGDEAAAAATSKKLASEFALYGADVLKQLKELGFDVYSGAYNRIPDSMAGSSKGGSGDSEKLSIEYLLDGADEARITGKQIKVYVENKDTSKITANVINIISSVMSVTDPIKQYQVAMAEYKKAEKYIELINKTLWMHNASMYINGSKTKIHTHDTDKWVLNTNTKVKTATVYNSTEVDRLMIKITGVKI